ncbi:MAG: FtsX-like permease family protein [Acidobacteria bacterium]|nr:MAG: FtsX-like permease family protein [Acidobacteriota bacterium]
MANILRDVRQALRTIGRMPVLASVIVLSLGAGIGVNATVFSWIQTFVFNPLPGVARSGSLHFIEAVTETGAYPGVSWAEFQDLRERVKSFRDVAAFRMAPLYVGMPGQTERAYGQFVSGNFFGLLNLQPTRGRLLLPSDAARPGGEPVVVISYDYWQSHFAGRDDAIGSSVRVNDAQVTVAGVAPRDFQGSVLGLSFDMWMPATMAPVLMPGSKELVERGQRGYAVLGRLADGVTATQATEDVAAAMRDLAAAYPASNLNITGEVLKFFDAPRGPQRFFASALWFLQIVMLLLLLTVCGNTANLVLARAMSRQREAGVRLALGARPSALVRLILTENLLLAIAGAAVGVLIAIWGTEALRAVPMTGAFPVKFQTHIDIGTLAFAGGLALLCGVLFGTPPAAQLAGLEPLAALGVSPQMSSRSSLRSLLMGAQLAMAVIVLAAAALFYQSFRETRWIDPGFRTEGVLVAAYDLNGRLEATAGPDDAAKNEAARTFVSRLVARLNEQPAVEAAAVSTSVPLDIHGLPRRTFRVEGSARPDGRDDEALQNVVTPGYFRTLGIPFRAGADFVSLEDRTTAPQVIVNDAFVAKYLSGSAALGRLIESRGRQYTIAGVVATTTYDAFGEPPTPIIYFSYRDRTSWAGEVHLRSRPGMENALAEAVRSAVRSLDPELPVYNVRTMTEHIDRNLVLRKIPARMFVVLGPLLLLLAAIGVYAVVAYTVSQRTTEIGVRLALGATNARVTFETAIDSFKVALNGVIAGSLVVVLVDLHLIRGGAKDLPALIGVPVLLLVVCAGACWWPARKAASLSPFAALRKE